MSRPPNIFQVACHPLITKVSAPWLETLQVLRTTYRQKRLRYALRNWSYGKKERATKLAELRQAKQALRREVRRIKINIYKRRAKR